MKNLNRRRVLLGGLAASGVLPTPFLSRAARAEESQDADRLFAELDEKILKGMEDFSIPGSAVSVVYRGREHVRGFGVANLTQPAPVDAATVFRLASNSKTYTGAAATRLVESGRLELDRPVRSYLEDFVAAGAQDVRVRQVLNHSSGWLGYDYHSTGSDPGALDRYVEDVRKLPQLTPVGTTFSYNNAALSVAGRVVEVLTGGSYESSIQNLLFEPLGLQRSLPPRRVIWRPVGVIKVKSCGRSLGPRRGGARGASPIRSARRRAGSSARPVTRRRRRPRATAAADKKRCEAVRRDGQQTDGRKPRRSHFQTGNHQGILGGKAWQRAPPSRDPGAIGDLVRLAATGALKLTVEKAFPLEEAAEAARASMQPERTGKIAFRAWERLSSVRFRMLLPSRELSRSRIAGGDDFDIHGRMVAEPALQNQQ